MHIFIMALFLLGSVKSGFVDVPKTFTTPAPPFQVIGSKYAFSTPNPTPTPDGLSLNRHASSKRLSSRMLPSDKGKYASIVGSSADGGTVGYGFNNYHDIVGIYVNNSFYPDLTLTNSTGNLGNTLYAPTSKGTDDSCLELNTYYDVSPTNVQTSGLRLYDFCFNGFNTTFLFSGSDSTFQAKYLRDFGEGLMYTAEVVGAPHVYSLKAPRRFANNVQSWRALLFNYQTNQWDLLWTTKPAANEYNGGGGWSNFETHYNPGQCPILNHTIYSSVLVSTDTINWAPASTQNLYVGVPYGDCFVDPAGYDPTNTISYIYTLLGLPSDSWAVTSNATVGGSPTCPVGINHCGYPGETLTFNGDSSINDSSPVYYIASTTALGTSFVITPNPAPGVSPNLVSINMNTTYGVTLPGEYTVSLSESRNSNLSNPVFLGSITVSICNISTQTCP